MSVKTVDIIKKETVALEEFWVIRGVKDTGLSKTVVAEFRTPVEPNSLAIAQFLINHPEADFCSVSHDYKIYEELYEQTMSERTIITTIEVKTTYKDVPKCFQLDKEQIANIQSIAIKRELNADDVVVTNVQEFDGGVE